MPPHRRPTAVFCLSQISFSTSKGLSLSKSLKPAIARKMPSRPKRPVAAMAIASVPGAQDPPWPRLAQAGASAVTINPAAMLFMLPPLIDDPSSLPVARAAVVRAPAHAALAHALGHGLRVGVQSPATIRGRHDDDQAEHEE